MEILFTYHAVYVEFHFFKFCVIVNFYLFVISRFFCVQFQGCSNGGLDVRRGDGIADPATAMVSAGTTTSATAGTATAAESIGAAAKFNK